MVEASEPLPSIVITGKSQSKSTMEVASKELPIPTSSNTDQSFMTVIQQAGIGETSMHKRSETVSHFDDIITNFVSKQVRSMCYKLWTSKNSEDGTGDIKIPELVPEAVDAFAAVVMVDVSGYSKLTAALAERGPVGAELLSKTMKGYLDQVMVTYLDHRSHCEPWRRHSKICWGCSNCILEK